MGPPASRRASHRLRATAASQSRSVHPRTTAAPSSPRHVRDGSRSQTATPTALNAARKRKQREPEEDTGDHGTNIHVVVRCRGRSEREVQENSGVVVSTNGINGKSVELSMGAHAISNKTYHFDKVFSPAADQRMVYDEVVTPILEEMLSGLNCTIFAYGQTGTGKTYTMSGDMSSTLGLLPDQAGIVPRLLHALFGKLEANETESSVKCSFIELYNEELRDLLSAEDGTKLKMYEENAAGRKNQGVTHVQGMEEAYIQSADEGIKLLQTGSHRRQVAATKCNDLSSRSHTVFTVTAFVKRVSEAGEEYMSAGKLNLVDLAGSENIQRSGAENKRAAEAGLINKSLLTLGRVINALVDRSSHIPYRESKLTRLLQDSLGGHTKTCIIATVSSARSNLEETVSTLDYAFRAKNIRNKPQVNATMSKKTLLREFTAEIQQLKSELVATRLRNGVYLANDAYEALVAESESRRILCEDQRAKIGMMEVNARAKGEELFSLAGRFSALKRDNDAARAALDEKELALSATKDRLAEQSLLRERHSETENELSEIGARLVATLKESVTDVGQYRAKILRTSDVQAANRAAWSRSQAKVSDVTREVEARLCQLEQRAATVSSTVASTMDAYVRTELASLDARRSALDGKTRALEASEVAVTTQSSTSRAAIDASLDEVHDLRDDMEQRLGAGLNSVSDAAERIAGKMTAQLSGLHREMQQSHCSLGGDVRGLLDGLVRHLDAQRAEADDLRRDLAAANKAAAAANDAAEARLDALLADERQDAARERQSLLAQIGGLIGSVAEAQEARLAKRVESAKSSVATGRGIVSTAQAKFSDGMDLWSSRECDLVKRVLESGDGLEAKMAEDSTTADKRSVAMQETAHEMQEMTKRVIEAQKAYVAMEMQALDDFASRARSQNATGHDARLASLRGLTDTVRDSYDSLDQDFELASSRVHDLGDDVSAQTTRLHDDFLAPIQPELCQPLATVREFVEEVGFVEDRPTGLTPRKKHHVYQVRLPRTLDAQGKLIERSDETGSESNGDEVMKDANDDGKNKDDWKLQEPDVTDPGDSCTTPPSTARPPPSVSASVLASSLPSSSQERPVLSPSRATAINQKVSRPRDDTDAEDGGLRKHNDDGDSENRRRSKRVKLTH
ncbi:MAG: hypothetical protein M1825_002770 [Sarcosagium campestre]|nr:MAG: hypothetical protein M1825_002770 [Sarcosagium campestre]